MNTKTRCGWVNPGSELDTHYHDTEWGVPVRGDQKLFEFFVLDTFQAGLSWAIILKKREGFRAAFADFDVQVCAALTAEDVERLMLDEGIIRNRLKIKAVATNAQAYLRTQAEFGSFSTYIWQFTAGKTIVNNWQTRADVPATSPESDAMAADLKRRGFKFCGTTICYAFMQAAGMINDHTTDCFRYKEVFV